jgi:hypothetical protein
MLGRSSSIPNTASVIRRSRIQARPPHRKWPGRRDTDLRVPFLRCTRRSAVAADSLPMAAAA